MNITKKFAQYMKHIRSSKKLTVRQMAEVTSIPRSTISLIEHTHKGLTVKRMETFLEKNSLSLEDFVRYLGTDQE